MGPGGLRRVWKGQGGSGRSGRVREDPEGSRRLREGAGGAGRINEGIVGLVWVLMGQEGSRRVLGGLGGCDRVQEGLDRHDGSTLVWEGPSGSGWVSECLIGSGEV